MVRKANYFVLFTWLFSRAGRKAHWHYGRSAKATPAVRLARRTVRGRPPVRGGVEKRSTVPSGVRPSKTRPWRGHLGGASAAAGLEELGESGMVNGPGLLVR